MSSPKFNSAAPGAMAERYAAGRMDEQEERDFESLMLERPELAAEVEAALGLRAGLRQLQIRGELDGLLRGRSRFSGWHYQLAAAVLLFIVGGGVLFFYSLGPGAAPSIMEASIGELRLPSAAARNVSTLILVHTRSRAEATTVTTSPQATPIALQILPEIPGENPNYRVILERSEGSTTVPASREMAVQAAADGFLRVYLNPTVLRAGDYQVVVTQLSHRESFALRVIAAP